MRRHPGFRTAGKVYRTLPSRFPVLVSQGVIMALEWHTALTKDPTGLQCVRLTNDVIERNQELTW